MVEKSGVVVIARTLFLVKNMVVVFRGSRSWVVNSSSVEFFDCLSVVLGGRGHSCNISESKFLNVSVLLSLISS